MLAAVAGCITIYAIDPASSVYQYWLVASVLICTTAAAFAINDYWDVEKDRLNHPERPLPSGRISRATAKRIASILFSTALFLALPLGTYSFLMVMVSTLLLWYYSPLLRYSGILGNVLVALLVSDLLLFSALVASQLSAVFYPMFFLFCFTLAKEIVWDVHDIVGDCNSGVVTLASLYGDRTAFRVVWSLLSLLFLSVPMAVGWLPMRYPAWFVVGSLTLLSSFSVALARYQSQRSRHTYTALIFWTRVGLLLSLTGLIGAMPPV